MGEKREGNHERVELPQHVAIIMDGNGRWAENQGLPRLDGHKKGVEVVRTIVEESATIGIKFLTLYSFSTENWKRSINEVQGLMALFQESIARYGDELKAKGVRVRFLGRREGLPQDVLHNMSNLEEKTIANRGLSLNLAINYGGRDEIIRAIHRLLETEKRMFHPLTENIIHNYLDTAFCPDPDLLIRTGGEKRVSNFLLWQIAYTELWFTETLWPDFTVTEFHQAIRDFLQRRRKFGGIG